jgi:rod shape-determining protein MreC
VFSPLRGVGDAIASPFRNGWQGITGYDDLEDENRELQRRIDELEGERTEAEAAVAENDELRRMLDLPVEDDIDRVYAEVLSDPLTSFDSTLRISKGSGAGIKRGMGVITDAGLVGRVVRVEGGRSYIQLITNPDYPGVGVKLVEARDVGIASAGPGGTLVVEEGINLGTEVRRGDLAVTSGYDGRYPGGIPVGTVESVGRTDDRTEQTLVLEPTANLDGLKYVAVLLCDEDCN